MLILMFVAIYNMVNQSEEPQTVAFSEFMTDVRSEQVAKVSIKTREHTAEYRYLLKAKGKGPIDERLSMGILGEEVNKELIDHGVVVTYAADDQNGLWGSILVTWI